MTVESWKSLCDVLTVALLFLTFLAGAGVLIAGNIINARQAKQLQQFDSELTKARTDLGKQQERAANADARVAGLEKDVATAGADMAKQQTRAAIAEKSLLELQKNSIGGKFQPPKGRTSLQHRLANAKGSSK